jgi:hypothetical protein
MTPAVVNLKIKTNGYYTALWHIQSNSVDVDLTGYTFEITVRETKGFHGKIVYELTTENGGISITDAAGGQIQVEIAPTTSIKDTKVCFYDLLAKKNGKEYVWIEGKITLDPGTSYTADD